MQLERFLLRASVCMRDNIYINCVNDIVFDCKLHA